jgi:hypothetical protein
VKRNGRGYGFTPSALKVGPFEKFENSALPPPTVIIFDDMQIGRILLLYSSIPFNLTAQNL